VPDVASPTMAPQGSAGRNAQLQYFLQLSLRTSQNAQKAKFAEF
jgi:hypothetical protein